MDGDAGLKGEECGVWRGEGRVCGLSVVKWLPMACPGLNGAAAG